MTIGCKRVELDIQTLHNLGDDAERGCTQGYKRGKNTKQSFKDITNSNQIL